MVDPGIPRGGALTPKGGANLLCGQFSRKLLENEDILDPPLVIPEGYSKCLSHDPEGFFVTVYMSITKLSVYIWGCEITTLFVIDVT